MKKLQLLKYKKILFAVVGALIIIATIAMLTRPKADTEEDIIWREYQVSYNDITASLDGGGAMESSGVHHSFDVDLKAEQILVEVGQEVKVGDVLVKYAVDELKEKVTELNASLQKAQRALADAKNNKQKGQLENELNANKTRHDTKTNYKLSKQELENTIHTTERKIKQLQEKITRLEQELQDAENSPDGSADLEGLKEQLKQAQIDLEAVQLELETQELALSMLRRKHDKQTDQNEDYQTIQEQIDALTNAILDNAIENAQADVAKIQKDLAKANKIMTTPELTAEVDGVVTELKYAEGDNVPGGKTIVTIGSSGEKQVVIQVSQEDIGGVKIGQAVEMQFLSAPDETLKGHVLKKSLVPSEGGDGINYKVTIAFDEEQPELLQGMTCSVKFILKRVEQVLTLSNKAITLKNGKQTVTVLLSDGTHEQREIQTGFSDGRVSEITGGLSDGETVVMAG